MADDPRMRIGLLGVVASVLAACTVPNPKSCADGSCTDPRYPFCDVDGAIAGSPLTCIAVTCDPGQFATCRGDTAITCNAAGSDFDLVSCPLGCASSGCRTCASDAQCGNPSPVCDADSGTCRACRVDDECASLVCNGGSCLASEIIVYASPTGSSTSSCSQTDPCNLGRAQMVATSGAVPALMRILPGVYAVGIDIGIITTIPLEIVATGATIASSTGVQVWMAPASICVARHSRA